MSPYSHYTAATDTTELAAAYRGPQFFNTQTVELSILDLYPSVPTRYVHRPLTTRLRTSPAAQHLRAATRAAFWPTAIGSGVLLAFVVLAYLHTLTPITGIR